MNPAETRSVSRAKAHATGHCGAYTAKNFNPVHNLGRLIARSRMAITEAFDRELAEFDITAAQYVILMSLANREASCASGLCRGMSYDPGAMTRMLDRLERRGLVRRVPRPNDRRAADLALTEEGRAVCPKLREAAIRVLNRFTQGFSSEEVRALESLLERLLANE